MIRASITAATICAAGAGASIIITVSVCAKSHKVVFNIFWGFGVDGGEFPVDPATMVGMGGGRGGGGGVACRGIGAMSVCTALATDAGRAASP